MFSIDILSQLLLKKIYRIFQHLLFRYEESICDVNISEFIVLEKLSTLKDNKAPGPDSIHPYVLKACAHALCAPLTMLFHQSLTSGDLPCEWKKVHVIPLHKKGSKLKATNYRPISLTSTVGTILESIICTELFDLL